MIKYFLILTLLLQVAGNKSTYTETFYPPRKTVSYIVKDSTARNPNHTYILTDEFMGIHNFPDFDISNAYVYNEHADDKYMGNQHWSDDPMLIIQNGKFWDKVLSAHWKDPDPKKAIIYVPPMEIQDDNVEHHWMPIELWVGEEWKGTFDFGGKPWTNEWHKIIDYKNDVWYIHSISIYLEAPSAMASCYDEHYKEGVLIYQKMSDCHDHITAEIHIKP